MTLTTKTKRTLLFIGGAVGLIVLGLVSFAFYHLILDATSSGIGLMGLISPAHKNLAIIIVGIIILFILGYTGRHIAKAVVK